MATPLRSVRVADEIWHPALLKAEADGVPLSAIIVSALIEFIEAK